MTHPKRVVFLSSCIRGGGAGWSLYYLLKHLDRDRVDPLAVLPAFGIYEDRLAELGVEAVFPPRFPERIVSQRYESNTSITGALSTARNVLDAARLVPWLSRLARRRGIDLIYCNNLLVEPIGALAAQAARVPCVLHARTIQKQLIRSLASAQLARLPAVRRVIANSGPTAVPYRRWVGDKVRVVHNGVDLDEYAPERIPRGSLRADLGLCDEVTIVGFTGFIMPRKGLDTLIRAAAKVLRGRDDVAFVIVGRVPIGSLVDHRAEYEALSRALGIGGRVIFAGFRDDVRPAVIDFDVLCLPSYQEPFGRSIVEAMALGRPVVASRVGGIPEIITDGTDGLLVPAGDPDALASAIARLVDDPSLRRELGAAARATVRTRFDVAVLTRRLQALLLEAAL